MRFFLFAFLIASASVCHANVVDEALGAAIRNDQVGRVRMLLHNHPHLDRLNPSNDWSYLWQALFSSDAYKNETIPALSESQREMSVMLLEAEPSLLHVRTGKQARTPLSALFQLYDQTCELDGCDHAKGIEERIRFLVEHGARVETELFETRTARLPLHFYLAGERPEAFELALSLGVPINDEFTIKTPVVIGPMRLLSFLTSKAIAEDDPQKIESALNKIEMLLRRGADPRKMHRAPNGAKLPIFVSVFLGWDRVLQQQSAGGQSFDTSRYPKILRLFFEYGLSESEDWGDSYISEWPTQDSAWRRASLRMLMQLVTSGEKIAPEKVCEQKLGEEAQASLK